MKFKDVYLFQIFDCLKDGEVYMVDREGLEVYRVSEMSAGLLSGILNRKNSADRYIAWVEEKGTEDENV